MIEKIIFRWRKKHQDDSSGSVYKKKTRNTSGTWSTVRPVYLRVTVAKRFDKSTITENRDYFTSGRNRRSKPVAVVAVGRRVSIAGAVNGGGRSFRYARVPCVVRFPTAFGKVDAIVVVTVVIVHRDVRPDTVSETFAPTIFMRPFQNVCDDERNRRRSRAVCPRLRLVKGTGSRSAETDPPPTSFDGPRRTRPQTVSYARGILSVRQTDETPTCFVPADPFNGFTAASESVRDNATSVVDSGRRPRRRVRFENAKATYENSSVRK